MLFPSKNDHFKSGFDGVHRSFRQSKDDEWFVSIGKCERIPGTFFEEAINVVKDIRSQTDKPLYFLFSGGIDSEFMCEAAIAAGISNFRIVAVRYANNANEHDLFYVNKWAERKNVDVLYLDFDAKAFWQSSEARTLSLQLSSVSPHLLSYAKMMHNISDMGVVPISGSGDFMVMNEDGKYVTWKREKILVPDRYLVKYNVEYIPSFFQYSPEIILAWLNDFYELEQQFPLEEGEDTYTIHRFYIYKKYLPDLELREKFTGFEFLHEPCWEIRKWMFTAMTFSNACYKFDTAQLREMLQPL